MPKHECKKGAPAWMATFSDLVTLLLCFFVLLFAFAKTEEHKLQVMLGSLRHAFGGYSKAVPVFGKSPEKKPTPVDGTVGKTPLAMQGDGLLNRMAPDRTSELLASQLQKKINDLGLDYDIEVAQTEDGVRVRAKDQVLFSQGGTVLKEESIQLLFRISQLIRATGHHLSVEGHSDSSEITSGSKYQDEWDLSTARAAVIVKYLTSIGVPGSFLKATGYGNGRPIADVNTAEGRKKNRRVEFLFSSHP